MSKRIEAVVLDSEGLSAWIAQDHKLLAMLQVFHDMGADLVIGANTAPSVPSRADKSGQSPSTPTH
uniref:Uncharacterized protein n=1 Tax=Streptomyces pratensis (strain ATCC 33331 / IAF-45CD) TaxID=591167 RepID=A0A8D4BC16_STRFA